VKRCTKDVTRCRNVTVSYNVQVKTNNCVERQSGGLQCCKRFAYRTERRNKTTRVCQKAKKAVFCGC